MANNYKRPKPSPVHDKRKTLIDGTPKQGLTSMGFKGPGGRPADQPPNRPGVHGVVDGG